MVHLAELANSRDMLDWDMLHFNLCRRKDPVILEREVSCLQLKDRV